MQQNNYYNRNKEIFVNDKKYEIISQIGTGSYGLVYLVQKDNIKYALKCQKEFSKDEMDIFSLSKGGAFKYQVNIYDYESNMEQTKVVMEKCECSLYEQMKRNSIDLKNIRYIMLQIAYAIQELHSRNYSHRDIKPENILVSIIQSKDCQQEIYKLCDYGTAKLQCRYKTQKVGTIYYLAPEQFDTSQKLTSAVDVWSFGCVIYEILTKQTLFQGNTIEEIQNNIINITDSQINQKISDLKISPQYKKILLLMLQKNPIERIKIEKVIELLQERGKSVSRQEVDKQLIEQRNRNYAIQQFQQNFPFQTNQSIRFKINHNQGYHNQFNQNQALYNYQQQNQNIGQRGRAISEMTCQNKGNQFLKQKLIQNLNNQYNI